MKLIQMCAYASTLPQARKLIFLFDRDNAKITKEVSGAPDCYKYWDNNVYSLCLPVPEFRSDYLNLSIEFYYRDDDLKTRDKDSGRRLWFSNEIEIITEPTTGEKVFRAKDEPNEKHEFGKKVFYQPSNMITDNNHKLVGLSKWGFAEKIILSDLSKEFDISSFRSLFDILVKISNT